ncbi:cytochrome P450 6k1-like [Colias croceus]|uniref:cytochrome P450 6k1-like n=1 Tax=Colias crocea TaxID=72248 RepID=UPI001E27D377|nr:cytochrome P450 6k1-like [Colias croceus]
MDVSMLSLILQWLLYITVFAIAAFVWFVYRRFQYWKDRGIIYEEPTFPLGNLGFIMRKSFWDFCFALKDKYSREYEGAFLAWKPVLFVNTPELARRVLVKDHEYFQDRYLYSGYSDPLGSLNLFTVKNPIWSAMRHELSPMFTSLRLKKITELMNINSTQLINRIEKHYIKGKKSVNLKELFSMYTSDTVAYSVFGLRVSVLNDHPSPLWAITSHMVKWTFWRGLEFTMIFFMPAIACLLRLKFFSVGASNYIKEIFWNVVNERKSKGTSSDKDLVNHLLKLKENLKLPANAGTQFADDLMLAQVAVFILGSVETSSTTLSYCLHELAYHPEEQEKLFKEIDEAHKTTGKDILEYDELMQLKYLSSCLHETLRKYPPVAYLDRICNKEYKLNDDVTIEKGIPVFVNAIAIHYDEKIFPEPEKWRPERMNASSDNDNLQFTFLPFGEGPRFCIGKRYGMMQMRTALAQVVHKYKLEPASSYKVESDPYSVILAPANGCTVKFVPR